MKATGLLIAALCTVLMLSSVIHSKPAAAPAQAAATRDATSDSTVRLDSRSATEHQVQVGPVGRKKLGNLVSVTALIAPDARAVANISPRVRARVMRLIAEPGQHVVPGEPLAILSSIELGQVKTEYLKARALSEIATQHLARERSLYQRKIASKKDFLEAQAANDTARAEYQAAREAAGQLIAPAELKRLDWSDHGKPLSEFALVSPIAGTLVKRDLTLGAIVNGDTEVMTVIDLDRVWVVTNVFEHDIASVKVGNPARIEVDAYPGQSFEGKVAYVADLVSSNTHTITARIEVHNPGHRLKPGMFAHAEIISSADGSRDVLAAPASAIYEVDGQKVVFVERGPNVFKLQPVKLGADGHGDVEVVSGLQAGQRVVTKGGLVLKAMLLNAGAE